MRTIGETIGIEGREFNMYQYFLVMNAWNYVVGRFTDEMEARKCARCNGGYIVGFKQKRGA